MLFNDALDINIKGIIIAHKFILDEKNRCEYPHGRGYYGVIYCIDGEAEYIFSDNKRFILKKGEVLLLTPEASYTINVKKEFIHYTVNFEINNADEKLEFLNNCFYLFFGELSHSVYYTFEKIVNNWMSLKPCYKLYATAYLYELIALLFSKQFEYVNNTSRYLRIQPAREYIEKNFNKDISLSFLAKYVNMSETHFRREWLNLYGESALKYRDKIRLSYAEGYLISGYYTVSEIADMCGFYDVNYFIRFFKKHTGVTPGKFERL